MNIKLLETYINRFDSLNQRERISIAGLALVSLAMFFYIVAIEPMVLNADKINKQISDIEVKIKSGEIQISALQKVLAQDPDTANRKQLSRLQGQRKIIDKKLQEKMQGLIEPSQMAKVLEAVVTQTSHLRIEKLNNLPTRPLIDAKDGDASEMIADIGVYRHGLQIELSGSYMNMLSYLKNLNSLPWDFYWDSLDLQVKKYPKSRIVIVVHTLSFKEGWIGV